MNDQSPAQVIAAFVVTVLLLMLCGVGIAYAFDLPTWRTCVGVVSLAMVAALVRKDK